MSHSLIMPKETGRQDVFYASLEIYYESYKRNENFCTNDTFKHEIKNKILQLGNDGAYLIKQSELTRYFGLVRYNYDSKSAKITPRGIKFFNAYLNNDIHTQIDLLIYSIINDSFGRKNTAIKSSDSDIDPPKLFIKALIDLGEITRNDLAYLIYVTHDKKISYFDAICQFKTSTSEREINIPQNLTNKYHDVKFTVLLSSFGICIENNNKYSLAPKILEEYGDKIKNISIYNSTPDCIYTLKDNDQGIDIQNVNEDEYDIIVADEKKNKFEYMPYDISSINFKRQNNRIPEFSIGKGGSRKYKTNPRISKTALYISKHECELNKKKHITFESKFGTQFMEAHHLIPMQAQSDFSNINLDRIENIVCICPTCHKAIHNGSERERLNRLMPLYNDRISMLNKVGIEISFGDLFHKYYK